MQAWQVEPCTYVIKYSIYGRPGISDFGFRYAATRNWEGGGQKAKAMEKSEADAKPNPTNNKKQSFSQRWAHHHRFRLFLRLLVRYGLSFSFTFFLSKRSMFDGRPNPRRSSSGGSGNTCTTDGPYGGWTADGSMVKIDETKGCDQQATFYVKATLTTLITTGTSSSPSTPQPLAVPTHVLGSS
jgi:hypothetical protein